MSLNEIWKPIKGFEGLYEISNLGNVKALKRWRNCNKGYGFVEEHIMKSSLQNGNYYRVPLTDKKHNRKYYSIHRLVAEAFLDKTNFKYIDDEDKKRVDLSLLEVNHKDGNKENNNIDNLEWCTRSYNIRHAYFNGLNPTIKQVYEELLQLRKEVEELKKKV